MPARSRRHAFAIAGLAAITVAVVSVVGGVWLRGALRDDAVDGAVVLDEPGVYQQPADEVNVSVTGRTVPDVELVDVDGNTVRLSDYRGSPLVVNLWFANCPPCQRELQDFADVHAQIGDRVRFVGVDPFDSVEVMQRFAAERGVEYELLRDPDRAFTNEIEVVAFPVTLFVSPDGEILEQTGVIDADELLAAVDELF